MLDRPDARPALGVVMVVAAGVLFAVNGTVSKLVLQAGLTAQQLTLVRAAGAATALLALSLAVRPGPRRLAVTRRDLPLLAGYGLTGFFAVPMLYFVAISRLPVGIGLLFEYTAPLLVALWARLVQRQRVRSRLWLGLGLSLGGLACVAEVWGDPRLDGLGVLAGLGAAVLLAAYYLLGARGIERRDTLSLTTWAFGVAAAAGLLTGAATAVLGGDTGGWRSLAGTTMGIPVPLLCAYVVLLGSVVPYLLVAGALRHLPATSVGIVGMVEPVIAAAVAWIILGAGEALNAAQLTGGALVLFGVALAESARTALPGRRTGPPAPDVVAAGTPDEPGAQAVHPVDLLAAVRATSETIGPPTPDDADRRRASPIQQDGDMQLHPNVQAVQYALDDAGARDAHGRPCQVRMLPDAVHTATAAAAALDVEVGQIANSLIFDADGEPLLVLTSGAHRVDTDMVAGSLGLDRLGRATPEFVREHTGQPIGGVAPLGHPKPVRTLVDTHLARYGEIWAAGGVPRAVFPTTYEELLRITSGTATEVE